MAGVRLREPSIDFALPEEMIPLGTPDSEVLAIAADSQRILVTHDRKTMPAHFAHFVAGRDSTGVILIPKYYPIGEVIDTLVLIWQASNPRDWINHVEWLPL